MRKYLGLMIFSMLSIANTDGKKDDLQDSFESYNPSNQRRPRILAPSMSLKYEVGSVCTNTANGNGVCTRLSGCFSSKSLTVCPFNGEELLLCCPESDRVVMGKVPRIFTEPSVQGLSDFQISASDVNQAAQRGLIGITRTSAADSMEARKDLRIKPGSKTPEGQHLAFFQPTQQSRLINNQARMVGDTGVLILQSKNIGVEGAALALQNVGLSDTLLQFVCEKEPMECNDSTKYRSADGSCNNLQQPLWGKSNTRFQRLLLPDYSDQISAPRVAFDGTELPSARLISTTVTKEVNDPLERHSLLLMQWGQFIDHDLTLAPLITEKEGDGIKCCLNGLPAPVSIRHPGCFPIDIPANDSFYSFFGQKCMEFVRSAFAMPKGSCNLGYLEQLNSLTHFMDGSQIYGSTLEDANNLREFRSGRLKAEMSPFGGKCFLPPSRTEVDGCSDMEQENLCFKAGDVRVNEQVDLTVLHTLWLREHNRVAEALARMNPHWNDNKIYEESRRIVIAELQHITYSEWLPIIIGSRAIEAHDLSVYDTGYGIGYDSSVNPLITNEFASAAFRFGHSLVQGLVEFGNGSFFNLHKNFNNPFILRRNQAIDLLTMGLLQQNPQSFDEFFTESITNNLFQNENPFGMDLVSLNIQRGRDHGIPGYNSFRELCGLGRAASFSELSDHIDMKGVLNLQSLYKSVDDVDLFIGGVLEKHVEGGIVGPTFACIIADTFARVKRGDRYFYDHSDTAGSFSLAQLNEVRKVSLARIICDNLDHDIHIQTRAFWSSRYSGRYPCSSRYRELPKVNLYAWKERPQSYGNGGFFNFGNLSQLYGPYNGYVPGYSSLFPQNNQNSNRNSPNFGNGGKYQQGDGTSGNQKPFNNKPNYNQYGNRPNRYQQVNNPGNYQNTYGTRNPLQAAPPQTVRQQEESFSSSMGFPSWMSSIAKSFWTKKK